MSKIIEISQDFITLDPDEIAYQIPFNRCKDLQSIAQWKNHLSEKSWITQQMLQAFENAANSYLDAAPE